MSAVNWFKNRFITSNPLTGTLHKTLLALTTLSLLSEGTSKAEIIPPGCLGNGYGISLFVDKQRARIGDTLKYSLLVNNLAFPACRADQITAAIVTPDGTTNRVTLNRTTLNFSLVNTLPA